MLKRKTLLLGGAVVLTLFVLFFVKINIVIPAVSNVTKQQYVSEEYVQEQIPVNATLPYQTVNCENKHYNYSSFFNYSYPIINNSFALLCNMTVTNHESVPGNFSFYITIKKRVLASDSQDQEKRIGPNETVSFIWTYAFDDINDTPTCFYKINFLPRLDKCSASAAVTYQQKEVLMNKTILKNVTRHKEGPNAYEIKRMSLISTILYYFEKLF